MRGALFAAVVLCSACEQRILYTVEGAITNSVDDAPIGGVRVTCAIEDDEASGGESISDSDGAYSCSAVSDGPSAGRGPRRIVLTYVDEDDAQNGTFSPRDEAVVVDADGIAVLDVELDPAS